jgi:RNA polymerase sigma-70 factor (ECF subfamily)
MERALDEKVLDLLDRQWDATDAGSSAAAEALGDCIRRMPSRSRELIDLRYRDGILGKRLAERCSQPPNTVYVTLSRIHRMLSECVKTRLAAQGVDHA